MGYIMCAVIRLMTFLSARVGFSLLSAHLSLVGLQDQILLMGFLLSQPVRICVNAYKTNIELFMLGQCWDNIEPTLSQHQYTTLFQCKNKSASLTLAQCYLPTC